MYPVLFARVASRVLGEHHWGVLGEHHADLLRDASGRSKVLRLLTKRPRAGASRTQPSGLRGHEGGIASLMQRLLSHPGYSCAQL